MSEELPEKKSSLAKTTSNSLKITSNSIQAVKKLFSESIYEFYGDFEGKKVWEIKAGYNEWANVYQLFLGKRMLVFCQQREAIKLFSLESGNIENSISVETLFEKDDRENEIYQPDFDFILPIKEQNIMDCDCFLLALVNNTLFKISLPSFSIITKKQFRKKKSDYSHNSSRDTWTVTTDNKYLLRVIGCDYRSKYKGNIIQLWDSEMLEIVNSFEIPFSKYSSTISTYPFLIPDTNLFLCLTPEGLSLWNYLTGTMIKDFHFGSIGVPSSDFHVHGTKKVVDYNAKNGLLACIFGNGSTIHLFQLESGCHIKAIELSAYVDYKYTELRFSNNGNYLLAWGYNVVHLYDTKSLNLIARYSDFYYHKGEVDGEPDIGVIDSFYDFTDKYIYTLDCAGTIHKWK